MKKDFLQSDFIGICGFNKNVIIIILNADRQAGFKLFGAELKRWELVQPMAS